jgi:eukaryotic-like serine/threonine-protein kinase
MTNLQIESKLTIGTIVAGKYRVEGPLGEGGFATVYAARHVDIPSLRFAIKVLHREHTYDPRIRGRFRREAETVAALSSRNIVRVLDIGELENQQPFIVMEFISGRPLDSLLASCGRLYPGDVARLCIDVLKALDVAHAQGVVHRDLKPANVFAVQDPGEPVSAKVLDFGIAKVIAEAGGASFEAGTHTVAGNVVCTPQYAAPELLAGKTSPMVDLYALGHMMAELLEGVAPYEHLGNSLLIAAEHLRPDPVPLGLYTQRSGLAAIVAKACAKPEEERFQTAREMLDALRAASRALREPGPSLELVRPYDAVGRLDSGVTRDQPSRTDTLSARAIDIANTPTIDAPTLRGGDSPSSISPGGAGVRRRVAIGAAAALFMVVVVVFVFNASSGSEGNPAALDTGVALTAPAGPAPGTVASTGSGATAALNVPAPPVEGIAAPPLEATDLDAAGPTEASSAAVAIVEPVDGSAQPIPGATDTVVEEPEAPPAPVVEAQPRPVRRPTTPRPSRVATPEPEPETEPEPEPTPEPAPSNNPFGNIEIRR